MNNQHKNFILLVEMLERELPAAVLLGSELAGRGHTVWLIEKGRFRKSPASFTPSMVLEKGLTTGCLERYRAVRRAGHLLTVMCQEGFTYRSGEDYVERRVWGETLETVDNLFLWGERQKTDLEKFLPKVRYYGVTGSPRFDLLHSRFHKCWEAQEADIRQKYGDFVFVTSRFGAVNHFRRDLDGTLERRTEIYTGSALETVNERFTFLRKLFLDYVNIVEQMAGRFPDLQFIVRPHPLESVDVWKSHFQDIGNVLIRDGGSAIPWMSAARCVIHSACTTGIEAYILNRPVTEYYPACDSAKRSRSDASRRGHRLLPQSPTNWSSGSRQISREARARRRASSDELIAHHLKNAQQPNAYTEMAAALESFRAPPPWAGLLNKVSRERIPKKDAEALHRAR